MAIESLALASGTAAARRDALPPIPWRDPHSVPPEELQAHIARLEAACLEQPRSADLRTALGMAYAMNYDVYKSLDALAEATAIDPTHFWAQLKLGELHYRLRALAVAERETMKALALARNGWQLAVARRQLQEIRRASRISPRNITWGKPLLVPALVLSGAIGLAAAALGWIS